jgi:phosphate transport system substrate-binding protein
MSLKKNRFVSVLSAAVLIFVMMGQVATLPSTHSTNSQPRTQTQAPPASLNLPITLHGQGATFPQPLINVWAQQYHASVSNVTIVYNPNPLVVGSGSGQLALIDKTADFAASDAPLSSAQRDIAPNVLHIPEAIGSVVLAYNLPGITTGLNLTGPIIASIYLGQIKMWNDSAIQAINPTITLPQQNITTVHRSDSSGTTFVFTSYLSSQSTTWATTPGLGAQTSVTWPGSSTGVPPPKFEAGNGNGGVATLIAGTSYSIGYVELQYALGAIPPMTYASVRNNDNTAYILPSVDTTTFAVKNYTATHTLPNGIDSWASVSMLNQAGLQTYPIASFTYLLVYREMNVVPSMNINETAQFSALKAFLSWIITTGQTFSTTNHYVPIPSSVVAVDTASIASMTYAIQSKSVHHTFWLQANSATGWNGSKPGPTISVVSGDSVTLNLLSADGLTHQWFLDFNNNGVIDPNENNTTVSSTFSSTSTYSPFQFVPHIFNTTSIPSLGNWTYADSQSPGITGTFRIIPQQIAIPFQPPNQSPTSTLIPAIDTSRVTTVGSLIVDMRTLSFRGIVNETRVDTGTKLVAGTKGYDSTQVNLQLRPVSGLLQAKFVIQMPASPYTLSSNIIVTMTGLTGTATYQLSRELDIVGSGRVDIGSLSFVAFYYKTDPTLHPTADVNANLDIGIDDLSAVAFFYHAPAFS